MLRILGGGGGRRRNAGARNDVGATSVASMVAMLSLLVLCGNGGVSSLVHPSPAICHRSYGYNRHAAQPIFRRGASWALMMSEGDDQPSAAAATKTPSKRAQRKAAERSKKQRIAKQNSGNKATSQHPEAVLKRERQNSPQGNNRRKHNFAERAKFLQEREGKANGSINGDANGNGESAVVHPLHSTAVDKLDIASTTADEVVQAIKRAQNLHDVHDVREIAKFLLEDVGEFYQPWNKFYCFIGVLVSNPCNVYRFLQIDTDTRCFICLRL